MYKRFYPCIPVYTRLEVFYLRKSFIFAMSKFQSAFQNAWLFSKQIFFHH